MKKLGKLTMLDMIKACEGTRSCDECPIAEVLGSGNCNIFDITIDIRNGELDLDTEVDV